MRTKSIKNCFLKIQNFGKYFKREYAQRLELSATEHDTILPFEAIPSTGQFNNEKSNFIVAGLNSWLHKYIDKHHHMLGTIFRDNIGTEEAIFISSPELMRAVFLYEGKYPKHPLPDAWKRYNEKYSCERGLFFLDDEEWLKYRKIMNHLLLKNDTRPIQEISIQTSNNLVEKLKYYSKKNCDKNYEIDNLEKLLYRWSIDEILALLLGNSYFDNKNLKLMRLVDIFADNVHKIFEYSAKIFIVLPELMDTYREFEKVVTETLNLANEIIDTSMEVIENPEGLLLALKEFNISHKVIQKIFADLIIAAGDTTAFSTQWALYLLARDVNTQSSLRNQLLHQITEENFYETPLVKGIVREAMRLYPVAPFIGRYLDTDAILGNYRIPKNTLVLLSLYTAGRDERNFTNPLKFAPMRWDRGSISRECVIKPHASIPFAMGGRSCIGRKIANNAMHVLLTKILQHFQLNLLNQNEIHTILRMITVPSERVRISFKSID